MSGKIPFDPEGAAFQIKTLHGLMDEINGNVTADNFEEVAARLWGLLNAMEPLVNGLHRYFSEGGTPS
ncbi:MAG: hypothetical protein ACI3U8_02200 [Candidatus Onthomonas sp.]